MYHNHLLTQKYFDPLNATRQDHDRIRKSLRESWRKEKRRLVISTNLMNCIVQLVMTAVQAYNASCRLNAEG